MEKKITDEQIVEGAKHCNECDLCEDCPLDVVRDECAIIRNQYIIDHAKKEPASAGTPTSSEQNISNDSVTLSVANVKLAVRVIADALNCLNNIYNSRDIAQLTGRMAINVGNAMGDVQIALDLLRTEEK